ncbi:MAG: hypothetical protein ABIN08_08525 [Caldimonas sp.]
MKLRNAAPEQPGQQSIGTDVADPVLQNRRRRRVVVQRIDRRVRKRADRGCRRLFKDPAKEIGRRLRLRRATRVLSASQDDDAVAISLAPHRGGLLVECERTRGKRRAVVTMQFADESGFLRWCARDRLQFLYPLLYVNLRRSGSEFFTTV